MLYEDLEGWDGAVGGRLKREEINTHTHTHTHTQLIHFVVQEKHNIVKQLYSN